MGYTIARRSPLGGADFWLFQGRLWLEKITRHPPPRAILLLKSGAQKSGKERRRHNSVSLVTVVFKMITPPPKMTTLLFLGWGNLYPRLSLPPNNHHTHIFLRGNQNMKSGVGTSGFCIKMDTVNIEDPARGGYEWFLYHIGCWKRRGPGPGWVRMVSVL